jgi:hypothetical protein
MRPDHANLIQVTGATQFGKSTLAAALVAQRDRVVIVSPFPINKRVYPDVEQFPSVNAAVLAFMANPAAKTFRVAVVATTAREFAQACQLAWVLAPCTLVPDETMLYLPNAAEAPMEFKMICQAWAHAGDAHGQERAVSVIFVGQRPINAPPIFRSEVQVWYLFRLNAESDRRLLRDDFGLTREQADEAGKLPRFSYIRVDKTGGRTYGETRA